MLTGVVHPLSRLSPALLPLWQVAHSRLSSGQNVTRVRPGPLTPEQREALADLLGLARLPPPQPIVSMAALDVALRDAVGLTTREVVTHLVGPLGDRVEERQRARAERDALWAWVSAHPVVRAQPALDDWVAAVRRTGLIEGSVERTRNELDRALGVLAQLPVTGDPLPVFAEAVLGDTHALDEGTRCSGLVLKALAAIYGTGPPMDTQQRRELWERAGIADDELSSTVLVAGVHIDGDDVVSKVLRVCAESGQAAVITLQQLRSGPGPSRVPDQVWVVENPSVLAMALRRFGPRCPPLVCTAGWPSSAGIMLLRRLRIAGSALRYHGDFDGDGLRIAAHVVARTGARPWRMSSTDYLGAVTADGPPVGTVTAVPWDDGLAGHLVAAGTTVPEERVATTLLDELATHLDPV
jgi:uncharacterized protein (TIGR02679 family)